MLWQLFANSDVVKYPLALFSILALAIVFERLFTLSRLRQAEDRAFGALQVALEKRDDSLVSDPQFAAAPVSQVMSVLTTLRGASFDALQQAADVALSMQRMRLRRYLSTLATIGSTAPFIGLFGTVLGVLQAFQSMSKAGSNVEGSAVAGNIGAALSATAVGLLVAIPSVMAYNFLVGQVQANLLNVQGHVSRLMPLLERGHALASSAVTAPSMTAARSPQEA